MAEIISVSELNNTIKLIIDNSAELRMLCIRGEISNFKAHSSGHLYFSLKDEDALVRCVMFRSSAYKLKFIPENGMKVLLYGSVSVYAKDGSCQIYATGMEPDGVGALYIAYEQLRTRLEAEGLFERSHKLVLPKMPKTVGVVTSPTGAAVRDIINVTGRRFPMAKILLFPALVQGVGAAQSIADGIRYFNKTNTADVIIVGRGGGSIEDLWAFNDEELARTVYNSQIPIISAVGHETDFTICDFVADVRAATPSAAAELAVPDMGALSSYVTSAVANMQASVCAEISRLRDGVSAIYDRAILYHSQRFCNERRMRVIMAERNVSSGIKRCLQSKKTLLSGAGARLSALNPISVLSRGYAVATDKDGKNITDADNVKIGDKINILLKGGSLCAEVTGKTETENF